MRTFANSIENKEHVLGGNIAMYFDNKRRSKLNKLQN